MPSGSHLSIYCRRKDMMQFNIQPNKKLDQYFLKNEDVLDQEIRLAELTPTDIVLEVGAGPGNLTERIAKHCKVIAVEKDDRFISVLKKIKNVDVVNDDILNFLKEDHEFNKVVSNVPYSISQDIVIGLLTHKTDGIVLIVQKEFAEKMIGKGKLGLFLEDCSNVEIVRSVSAKHFTPKAVESSLVKITQNRIADMDLWKFLKDVYRSKNRNAGSIDGCPDELKQKKIHQLSLKEIRQIINPQTHKS